MGEIEITPLESFGRAFIPPGRLPDGQDQHHLRDAQSARSPDDYRPLTHDEIAALRANGNTAEDWSAIRVSDPFFLEQVRGCAFAGLVRLGRIKPACLRHDGLELPAGLFNSRLVACDIGDNCAIHDVGCLAHCLVGDNVLMHRVEALLTTPAATFGHGVVKDGRAENDRLRLALVNEAGGRAVAPFAGMRAADACLAARYRDDAALMARLDELTQKTLDARWGLYGQVGDRCVIRGCGLLRDVRLGPAAKIEGAARLENVTVDSAVDQPTRIGAGCELVDGIVGVGCRVDGAAQARRFVLAPCSSLLSGARLADSFLGDNSTFACGEMLHSLVFPAHEQHHKNSFLIAALVGGQSNLAAGATIGSNHNSRAPDGELLAGRGFWPGLCVSLKHSGRLAAYTLIAKGDYPYELNVPLPFSLLRCDGAADRLLLMPAYWWLHNMYALARNTWKFAARDRRRHAGQGIEFDFLAPDTAEEMFTALALLEQWAGKAALRARGQSGEAVGAAELAELGRQALTESSEKLEVFAEGVENSRRPVVVLKAAEAWRAYREMLNFYAVRELLAWLDEHKGAALAELAGELAGPRVKRWVNLGGQLVSEADLDELRRRIRDGELDGWPVVHHAFDQLWARRAQDRCRHALATLLDLHGAASLTDELWQAALDSAVATAATMAEQTYLTRKKDYDNLFRQATFDSPAEQAAVVGAAEDNDFVRHMRRQAEDFAARAAGVRKASGPQSHREHRD